jgi:hypothetical protein
MFRKIKAIMLAAVVLFAASGIQAALAQAGKDNQAEKARAKVQQIGSGTKARVQVRLLDNTKLKGYISAVSADSFTVTDSSTGATQTVAYTDVAGVKKQGGGGLSTRTLIILGAVAVTAVIVGVTVIKPVLCDGGAGC